MVMLMPPYHGATLRADDKGIVEHFARVAEAGLPIMVQDAPLSGVALSVPLLARLGREVPLVRFFKIEMPGTAGKLRALIAAAQIEPGGAAIIYLFLTRVLTSPDEELDPADFEMVGVLGRLYMPVREGGTGELIYSQAGTRRVCGARSEQGSAILKGTEVVVTRYEKGIAYVRPWSEMAGEESEMEEGVPDPAGDGR